MAFSGQISIASTSRTDILSGIATSGKFYNVRFHSVGSVNLVATNSNSATVGPSNLGGITFEGWDGATPLYVYNPNGGAEILNYVVTEIPSIGLSVSC